MKGYALPAAVLIGLLAIAYAVTTYDNRSPRQKWEEQCKEKRRADYFYDCGTYTGKQGR